MAAADAEARVAASNAAVASMQAMLLEGRQAMQRRLEAERERVVAQMRSELKSAEARMQAENAAVASKLERTEEKVAAIHAEKDEVRSLPHAIETCY